MHFRLWAPRWKQAELVLGATQESTTVVKLKNEQNGYFSAYVREASIGSAYQFRADSSHPARPDPASRFQPEGPHGPSRVVDPTAFVWTDAAWTGPRLEEQVVYEMHIGTFTPEGTWNAAVDQLPELADLGITTLEVMPVAEFPGNFGWGYDGVDLFAPTRVYGEPDDFRRFVDRAHHFGLSVILDVVYNHFGPDGNYLKDFSPAYFTDRYKNDWGEAINFDGPDSEPVREYFLTNARYWIEEFHLDGLRLDATQQIYDASPQSILGLIGEAVRAAAPGRRTFLVAENEPQDVKLVQPLEQGGHGLDAIWNDDFHHSAVVRLTGKAEAYYTDYPGTPQEFISAAKYGFLYQGQWYKWQKQRRGTSTFGTEPTRFVNFIQNHDQIANSFRGERVHALTSPDAFRAMTALCLLFPGTPMLFQGEEFAASAPFLYFADHEPKLARLVAKGRQEFLAQFPSLALPEMARRLPNSADPETFRRCKLDFSERKRNAPIYRLHRDLLRLRRDDLGALAQKRGGVDGAVLGPESFVLRYFANDPARHRLLLVNFGIDQSLDPAPEPLLAPPANCRWKIRWSSEAPEYGGMGTREPDNEDSWHIPGIAAIVLAPQPVNKD